MKQAVEHSAAVDAHHRHCEKESILALEFIQKFQNNRKITKQETKILTDIGGLSFQGTSQALDEAGKSCKEIDVIMQKYETMRKLKDVSYMLNGIDPKTLPEPKIPNLKDLLPPKPL